MVLVVYSTNRSIFTTLHVLCFMRLLMLYVSSISVCILYVIAYVLYSCTLYQLLMPYLYSYVDK
jgi:hypothetical protein